MTKIERFEAIDKALFWKEKKILVIGDLHLGYEEALSNKGIIMPPILVGETLESLKKILENAGKLNEIILLGDVKHALGSVVNQEMRDVFEVFSLLKKNLVENGKIVIVKGNHDNILEGMLKRFDFVELRDFYCINEVLFFHGNKKNWENIEIYDKKYKEFVVGHFHPAIIIEEDVKREKYKCFVLGKFKGKDIIIAPSFFALNEGVEVKDILNEIKITKIKIFAISPDGEVYDFGKMKK